MVAVYPFYLSLISKSVCLNHASFVIFRKRNRHAELSCVVVCFGSISTSPWLAPKRVSWNARISLARMGSVGLGSSPSTFCSVPFSMSTGPRVSTGTQKSTPIGLVTGLATLSEAPTPTKRPHSEPATSPATGWYYTGKKTIKET
ncbi:hypothetical protein HanIR_Chr09g0405601 [Helianthus annuus]|nr:hypothetical protein HanIR_Chr09g0405601 [Helianthus annuus]